ncbi:DUF3261 domain-containing protein [Paraglaciecola polaris]|uniref:DUF3261 domain-containing protein n=1 Tax=Paraglaciecola polaris LMG 21857 TaxID=1129793 RepID=K7ADL9_9ALTE|nr:DUF3261 domain-containing protein [Paraglaciecola polaris]GAC33410.1 hypothetical protein GPLA_2508 [Paraglaciecola polaris LMG 21857]
MSKRLILVTALLMAVNACSSMSQAPLKKFSLHLLAPKSGPKPALYQQKLSLYTKGNVSQVLVVLKVEYAGIKLRALLPTGQSLYSINYDGQTLSKQNLANVELPAEEMLSMLQFALWPSDILHETYNASGNWQIEETKKFRLLTLNGKNTLRVDFVNQNTLHLTNYPHQYNVKVETLEHKRL